MDNTDVDRTASNVVINSMDLDADDSNTVNESETLQANASVGTVAAVGNECNRENSRETINASLKSPVQCKQITDNDENTNTQQRDGQQNDIEKKAPEMLIENRNFEMKQQSQSSSPRDKSNLGTKLLLKSSSETNNNISPLQLTGDLLANADLMTGVEVESKVNDDVDDDGGADIDDDYEVDIGGKLGMVEALDNNKCLMETDEKTHSSTLTSPAASTPGTTTTSSLAEDSTSQDEKLSGHMLPMLAESPNNNSSQDNGPCPKSKSSGGNLTSDLYGSERFISQPINIVRNGTIPNAGKPQMSTISKKLEKSVRAGRSKKPKVAMYESEISENKTGIRLCIKKSDNSFNSISAAAAATATTTATSIPVVARAISKSANTSATSTTGRNRKSSRSLRQRARSMISDEDDTTDIGYQPKRKKERTNRKAHFASSVSNNMEVDEQKVMVEQSAWGMSMPEPVLFKIFLMIVESDGCLPTLLRLGRVCSLWRRVSLRPLLWKSMDLSTWIKEKYRTELKLKWFVDNRCSWCTELNVSNWKVSDVNCFLHKLAVGAPNLVSITLAGWKCFTSDHLAFLVEHMKKLERIDLSSINVEMNASKSAVGLLSLCNSLQAMNKRLTHIYLAHNRLAGIPQLVTILSTHCPNLILLDLSNVSTQATSHGILHIEKLQLGCPKLRVLRITNSHITLSTASMQEIMDSPGFPELEELSVAALSDESRIISDEHLQRILKSSSKLKLLDVRCCTRLTHESLIRLPAWDIKHLFLSGCSVTRDMGSGLELIASKWAHSLIELDLAWANVQQPLDNALHALADKREESQLAHLNLCGSSVSEEAVKEILANCPLMSSINLSSCRGLPRGVKRLINGPQELKELREVLKVQLKVKIKNTPDVASPTTAPTAITISKIEGDRGGGGSGSTAIPNVR